MIVEDIMTKKVISVAKNRKLSDAINLMEKKRISRVVVTSDGELCGMLTEKDIAEHIGSARHGKSAPSSLHISTAMNSSFISIESGASTEKAAKTMLKQGISSLPVLNDGRLVGIVTKTDIVRTLNSCDSKLEDIMKTDVTTISPDDRIVHARRLMLDEKIGRVVAVEEGSIVGILTGMGATRALYAFKQATDKGHATRIRNIIVKEAMTPKVITLDIKAKVKDAIKIMKKNKFSGIPLTREGRLAGIVTKTDMLKIVK
jgi:CBS domain-containing protein